MFREGVTPNISYKEEKLATSENLLVTVDIRSKLSQPSIPTLVHLSDPNHPNQIILCSFLLISVSPSVCSFRLQYM